MNQMKHIWRENGTWFGLDEEGSVFKLVEQRSAGDVWNVWVYDGEQLPEISS